MDLMLETHFMGSGIEIGKCNQDLNHLLSKQISSKILGDDTRKKLQLYTRP